MDIRCSSIQETSQHSQCSFDDALVEWKSVEMMEDFLNNSFDMSCEAHLLSECQVDENGIPKHRKQVFIA